MKPFLIDGVRRSGITFMNRCFNLAYPEAKFIEPKFSKINFLPNIKNAICIFVIRDPEKTIVSSINYYEIHEDDQAIHLLIDDIKDFYLSIKNNQDLVEIIDIDDFCLNKEILFDHIDKKYGFKKHNDFIYREIEAHVPSDSPDWLDKGFIPRRPINFDDIDFIKYKNKIIKIKEKINSQEFNMKIQECKDIYNSLDRIK